MTPDTVGALRGAISGESLHFFFLLFCSFFSFGTLLGGNRPRKRGGGAVLPGAFVGAVRCRAMDGGCVGTGEKGPARSVFGAFSLRGVRMGS